MRKLALILAGLMLMPLIGCSVGKPAAPEEPSPSAAPEASAAPVETAPLAHIVEESREKMMNTAFGEGFTCTARLEYVFAGQTVARTFYYYIPSTWKKGTELPLMFSLHGSGSSAGVQLYWGNWAALAEKEGFVVVVPEAVGVHADGTLSCEGKSLAQLGHADTAVKNIRFHAAEEDPCGKYGVDDIQYLTDLIDIFAEKGYVDRSRVYCCGFSHGGFMSLRLAAEASDRFAGVAAVSGLLLKELDHLVPENKCKVVFIQGDADPHVPIEGMHYDYDGDGEKEFTWAVSLEDSVNYFLGHYGAPNAPTVSTLPDLADDGTLIQRYEYANEDGCVQVVKYVVEGGGHTWPGGTEYYGSGPVSMDAQAAELIWNELKDAVRE